MIQIFSHSEIESSWQIAHDIVLYISNYSSNKFIIFCDQNRKEGHLNCHNIVMNNAQPISRKFLSNLKSNSLVFSFKHFESIRFV